MQLALPINAHQNASPGKANRNCTCIPGAVYTFTPAHLPDPHLLDPHFEGLVQWRRKQNWSGSGQVLVK